MAPGLRFIGLMRRLLPIVAALAIFALTLRPSAAGRGGWVPCLFCDPRALADLIANVVLFAPLGVGLALNGVRPLRVLAYGAALSFLVEAAQFSLVPGRDANPLDVLYNALGAWLAAVLVWRAPLWREPRTAGVARGSAIAAAAVAAVVALEGVLLQPSLDGPAHRVEWTDVQGNLAPYDGTVLRAAAGRASLRPGEPVGEGTARAILRGDAALALDLRVGTPPDGLAQLLAIRGVRSEELVLVGVNGADLVVRFRTRSVDARLDRPGLVLANALQGVAPGSTVRVRFHPAPQGEGYCIDVDGAVRCGLGFTVGSGWRLLLYTEGMPAPLRAGVDLLCVALLLLPLGYFARRPGVAAAAALAAAATLAVLPGPVGLLPLSGGEGAAAVAGWLLGLTLGSPRGRYRRQSRVVDDHVGAIEDRQRRGGAEELGAPELSGENGD